MRLGDEAAHPEAAVEAALEAAVTTLQSRSLTQLAIARFLRNRVAVGAALVLLVSPARSSLLLLSPMSCFLKCKAGMPTTNVCGGEVSFQRH